MLEFPYQFESSHPFYDGNGRTGRILNLLMLQREGLLYLSRYNKSTKNQYYRLLQSTLDGEFKDFGDFLEERSNLMALQSNAWFEVL